MKYIIYCHIMHCQPDKIIKIECDTELQKDEIVKMIELQKTTALLIDDIKEA